MVPGVPYGAPQTSVWGLPTSHMNFCEEHTCPTPATLRVVKLTIWQLVAYGIHGIRRHRQVGSSPFSIDNIPYWGLIGVGLASSIYHATLQYHTAMGDEMSMHFAIGCVLIKVFTFQKSAYIQRRNAAMIIVGLISFVTYHCVTDEFTLHIIVFLGECITVIWKTRSIIRERLTDPAQRQKMATLSTFGTCCAGFAYFLWNIDVHLCEYVAPAKRQLGLPLGIFLELHGYWHILTSISSYTFMAMIEFLTYPRLDASHGVGFFWPVKTVLEDMASRRHVDGGPPKGKVATNGYIKKF